MLCRCCMSLYLQRFLRYKRIKQIKCPQAKWFSFAFKGFIESIVVLPLKRSRYVVNVFFLFQLFYIILSIYISVHRILNQEILQTLFSGKIKNISYKFYDIFVRALFDNIHYHQKSKPDKLNQSYYYFLSLGMFEIVYLNFRLIRLIGFDMLHTFASRHGKDDIHWMMFFKDLIQKSLVNHNFFKRLFKGF